MVALGGCCYLLMAQASNILSPASMESWRSLIADVSGSAANRFDAVVGIPGVVGLDLGRL